MMPTIQLHNQTILNATKVSDERPNRMLAAKLHTPDLAIA
jgi:hypothetical protein